jgi:hypothetical protein
MELEREVALTSQHSDTDTEKNKVAKKKKEKKVKKKKVSKSIKAKNLDKMKRIIEKIHRAKKKSKKKGLKSKKNEEKKKEKSDSVSDDDSKEESMDIDEAKETDAEVDDHEAPSEKEDSSSECVAPPLSSSGMSKLFALAGYQPQAKSELPQDKEDQVEDVKIPEKEDPYKSPVRPKVVDDQKINPPNLLRFSMKKSSPGFDVNNKFSSPEQDTTPLQPLDKNGDSTPDDLHQAIHHEDESTVELSSLHVEDQVEEPRIQSKSPSPLRLPKMRDSRSPAKVPIMRDQRSPIKQTEEISKEYRHLQDYPNDVDIRASVDIGHSDYEKQRDTEISYDSRRKHISPRRGEREKQVSPRKSFDSHDRSFRENNSRDGYSPRKELIHSPRMISPSRRDQGVSEKRYSPSRRDQGVSEKRYSPSRRDQGVPEKGYSPSRRDQGASEKRYSPTRRDQGVSEQRYSPTRRDHGSPNRYRSPGRGHNLSQNRVSPRREQRSPHRKYSPRQVSPRMHDYDSRARSPPRQDYDGHYKSNIDRPLSPSNRSPGRPQADKRPMYSPRYRDGSQGRRPLHSTDRYSPARRSSRPRSPGRYSPHGRRDSPQRDGYRKSRGHSPSRYSHRRMSPGRQRSPPRLSPGRYSPRNRFGSPYSPSRQGYNRDDTRRISPTRRVSPPRRVSPSRRSSSIRRGSPTRRLSPRGVSPSRKWTSPGGRRSPYGNRSPPPRGYSPRRRSRSPGGRYLRSPGRYDKMNSPSYRRSPFRPDTSLLPPSGAPPYLTSPRPDMRPDSTIPDSELGGLHHPNIHSAPPPINSLLGQVSKDYSDSPKRISLDERLERELGLARDEPQPHLPKGSGIALPTSIPTYDDHLPETGRAI